MTDDKATAGKFCVPCPPSLGLLVGLLRLRDPFCLCSVSVMLVLGCAYTQQSGLEMASRGDSFKWKSDARFVIVSLRRTQVTWTKRKARRYICLPFRCRRNQISESAVVLHFFSLAIRSLCLRIRGNVPKLWSHHSQKSLLEDSASENC